MSTDNPRYRVARNVQQLRKRRGLSIRELAARLGGLGHPVLPSVASKIELAQRRVDVDDLLALALALEVSPNRLLFTEQARPDHEVTLTKTVSRNEADVWRWATGERPLSRQSSVFHLDAEVEFPRMNRPHDPPDETTAAELFERVGRGELKSVLKAFREARERGLSAAAILEYLRFLDEVEPTISALKERVRRGEDGER